MIDKRKPRSGFWATLIALAIILPGASGSPAYTTNGISVLGSADFTPYAINNSGTIVGSVTTDTGIQNAIYWRGDTSVNLNQPYLLGSVGYAVNNAGAVAGIALTSTGDYRPSLWRQGQIVELVPRTGAATGISESGMVAGWALGDDFQQRSFLWRNGTVRWLMDTPSIASSVNERGQVVGHFFVPDGARAFLWEERRGPRGGMMNSVIDMGTLGGNISQALSVNGSGVAVGWSNNPQGEVKAFVYQDGQMQGLPDLGGAFSRANAITTDGRIVGAATTPDGESRAVLWSGGQVMDLNTVLPANSGWVLHGATAMNASGQVIGYGSLNDQPSSFLLSLQKSQPGISNRRGAGPPPAAKAPAPSRQPVKIAR